MSPDEPASVTLVKALVDGLQRISDANFRTIEAKLDAQRELLEKEYITRTELTERERNGRQRHSTLVIAILAQTPTWLALIIAHAF